jgi:hypothetical protein
MLSVRAEIKLVDRATIYLPPTTLIPYHLNTSYFTIDVNFSASSPAADRGLKYLQAMDLLLPEGIEIDVMTNLRDRQRICTWLGNYIDRVNSQLQDCLTACHDCFHPVDRRPIQIFAVPLPQFCGLDGLCNLNLTPTTILVDIGRVAPPNWLRLVLHEYAHAHLGKPGHDRDFAAVLSHLCLGLGLDPPSESTEVILRSFPPYSSSPDPLAFWRGELT